MYQRFTGGRGQRRGGAVLVLVAVCLVALMSVIAVAVDGGMLLDVRRQVQEAADAAALAGATDMFTHYPKNQGVDVDGTAKKSAFTTAKDNGFDDDDDGCKVTVRVFQEKYYSGPAAGQTISENGAVEVTIEYQQPRYFSTIMGSSDIPVVARAVARGRYSSFETGILILNLSQPESLKTNGNGQVTVVGAPIIVNSSDPSAVGSDGNGSQLAADRFDITGGKKSNTILIGPANFGTPPTPDPLAFLPQPAKPSTAFPKPNGLNIHDSTASAALLSVGINPTTLVNGTQVYILQPGRYTSLPNFGNNDILILQQASANSNKGVYYFDGSGFSSTGATILMDPNTSGGVMFYNDPGASNSASISISGGKVVISPPTTGLYKGMSIFQNRTATTALQISGQGGMNITGTFYAAKALMKITGGDATGLDVIGSQYISDTLQAGGNGKYKVIWDADKTAKTRVLQLVE